MSMYVYNIPIVLVNPLAYIVDLVGQTYAMPNAFEDIHVQLGSRLIELY